MSCFYCGKRVSLVRKRSDADFCCDDHREKYHARTLRTIETLRAADEQIAATRRLNEGMPMRGNGPLRGRDPESLLQRNIGSSLRFGWMAPRLPVSRRSNLDAHFPAAALCDMHTEPQRNGSVPPPVAEHMAWSIGHVQEGPRPPRAFRVAIQLPQGAPKRTSVKHAACDRPRRLRAAVPVEMGEGARAIARRIARRPAAKSLDGAMRAIQPPEPVQPPPPSPPVTVTLRHPSLPIRMGRPERPAAIAVRIPSPGAAGIRSIPPSAGSRPAEPAYVLIERRDFAIPGTHIGGAGMPRLREMRWGNRFIPCADGFRRRQFYSWEALERFCGMGFETIAGYRPQVRIQAAPATVPTMDVPRGWVAPIQDTRTVQPERRRPAPPFSEQVCLPGSIQPGSVCGLWEATPGQVRLQALDSRRDFPTALAWDQFAVLSFQRDQGALLRVSDAHWSSGSAEAFSIPAWARPHTRGSKRTACHISIGVRKPAFTGPEFAAGERRAGPAPEKKLLPPVFEPDGVTLRSENVIPTRAAVLPETQLSERFLEQSEILVNACRPPVGLIPASRTVYPAYAIPLGLAKPADSLRATDVGGLRPYPPARLSGTSFDIAKGKPRLSEIESLRRFRRRGYEEMRSRQTSTCWPAPSVPGLAALPASRPCAHPSRPPSGEIAAAMFRAHGLPSVEAFRLSCTVMDWQLLSAAMPGSTDWGRAPHVATIAMPLDLRLPVDDLGPIRDWGMTPPPEPEKPPEPVHEDFGAGLTNWNLTNPDWRQDIAGVRTGSLALLKPSLGMSEYEFEFLCKIENRSISWVFRAVDTNNYHAAQIALDPATGAAHLARFAVLGGERGQPALSPLDLPLGRSSSCRVKMSVLGNEFKLFLNDKPACAWSDDRLPEGGVGFFSEGEDRARLYWVKVTPYHEGRAVDANPPVALPVTEIHREMRLGVRNEQRANTIGSWTGDAAAGSAR